MGTLSINKVNHLFWLGRYTERVSTTLRFMIEVGDQMIDGDPVDYHAICRHLIIPDIYQDAEDFCTQFLFSRDNPDSIMSAMYRAYDNVIVLRETLSTDALSYIFMALDSLQRAAASDAPALDMQAVIDYILAFRGSLSDYILDDETRRIIELGRNVERIDLYVRLDFNKHLVRREVSRLVDRMYKTTIPCDSARMKKLADVLLLPEQSHPSAKEFLDWVDNVFIV
ncbi:MAG: alpha-E domain-containing protein [Oscillospiraceae bacterium]|nr:alpha-E domain-containing protein [Oscillospiraceae bacterium]